MYVDHGLQAHENADLTVLAGRSGWPVSRDND
jgi:hypothetical protein